MAQMQVQQQYYNPAASAPFMPADGAALESPGACMNQDMINGLNALARGVGPKLDQGFDATRESKHPEVNAQYWQLRSLSGHVKDNCLRSCCEAVKQTKELADLMSQSSGNFRVFFNDIHTPEAHTIVFNAMRALENSKLQVEQVMQDVNKFFEGANISQAEVEKALYEAQKQLAGTTAAVELAKDVDKVLGGLGVVVGGAGTVVGLAAAHVATGSLAAAVMGATALGSGGAVAVIALVGLLVYLHRANLKKTARRTRKKQAMLEEVCKEMVHFIAAIMVFQEVVVGIHEQLSKLCRECERLGNCVTLPSANEYMVLRRALFQGERVYKDCIEYEQILNTAEEAITASLNRTNKRDVQPYVARAPAGLDLPDDVVGRSGCGCWGPRRKRS